MTGEQNFTISCNDNYAARAAEAIAENNLESRFQGLGFRVQCSGFRGLGFQGWGGISKKV